MRGWSTGDNATQYWRVSAAAADEKQRGKSLMVKSKGDVESDLSPVEQSRVLATGCRACTGDFATSLFLSHVVVTSMGSPVRVLADKI